MCCGSQILLLSGLHCQYHLDSKKIHGGQDHGDESIYYGDAEQRPKYQPNFKSQATCALIESQRWPRAIDIQLRSIHVQAVGKVRPIGTQHIDSRCHNIAAHLRARACESSNFWLVLLACLALEVLEYDIIDGQWRWKFKAESQVRLSVALVNLDGVVNVIDEECVVCNVQNSSRPAASLEIAAQFRRGVWPDFDPRTVLFMISSWNRVMP